MTQATGRQPSIEAASAAERVTARYRAEFRRLLVAGILIAVAIVAVGLFVVYGLDQTPGMTKPGAIPSITG